MAIGAEEVYCKTMETVRRHKMTRRRFIQTSATALGTAAAVNFVPKQVRADVSGTVTHFAPAGKRLESTLRAVLPLFNKVYPNVTVEIPSLPVGEAIPQTQIYMSQKSDSFDAITGEHGQFMALDAVGALTDLLPFLEQDQAWYDDYKKDINQQYRYMWNIPDGPARDEGGPGYVSALAPDGNANMTFYRRDIFEKRGLKVPETWDDVVPVMKELHDPDNGVYGYCAAMARSFWAGFEFYAMLRSWGGDYFADWQNGDFTVTLDTEVAHRALTTLCSFQPYQHPITANGDEDQVNAAFANGSAVYGPLTWGTAVLNDPTYTDFHEDWHQALPPRGTTPESDHRPLTGGWGLFIPTWATNKEASFEWIKFVNSPDEEIIDAIVQVGGQCSRTSALERWRDRKPFFDGLLKAYQKAVHLAPSIPEAYAHLGAVGEEVADVCNDIQDVDTALKNMHKRVQRAMEDSGYYD